jgi:putative tricarboxylic transport membrane protein
LETLQLLLGGFAVAAQPTNLLFALIGCAIGTLIGVLPGISAAGATAMLIPLTVSLGPTPAIIMLAGIYYGAQYGGTITSVLINTPGEAASAITCVDGYQMAKQGRGGAALAVAAFGSFVGGTIATLGLVVVALPLAELALRVGPPEFFALMVLGLSLVTGLAGSSIVLALISAVIGLLIGMVGLDPVIGSPRFAFGVPELLDGFGIVPVMMGMFGVSEILITAEAGARQVIATELRKLMPTGKDMRDSAGAMVRGTGIGFFLGLIPGIGAVIPTFMSYVVEKKVSKRPEEFGKGAIAGVAGPETANNAYANAALIPLFTLGIPGSPNIAVLMGAFMMNGLTPGPFLFNEHPQFVWAVIASLFVGNVILVFLNVPLIPLWVSILRIRYSILLTLILGFCIVGAYCVSNSVFDIAVMLGFGLLGYVFKKLDIPLAPLALTFILGPLLERSLRQSMEMSVGDFGIFLTRPIALTLLVLAAALVATSTVANLRRAPAA